MYGGFLLGPLAKSRLLIGEDELLTWPFPEDRTPLLSAMISVVGLSGTYFQLFLGKITALRLFFFTVWGIFSRNSDHSLPGRAFFSFPDSAQGRGVSLACAGPRDPRAA